MRGPIPKSAEVRIFEGERAHRPLPAPVRRVPAGIPERPKGMTAQARRVWDAYVDQLAPLGYLRPVNAYALQRLSEDVALLHDLQAGQRRLITEMTRQAKQQGKKLAGGALTTLAASQEGRRLSSAINQVSARISRLELQFGTTPVSGLRLGEGVSVGGIPMESQRVTSIEDALCG